MASPAPARPISLPAHFFSGGFRPFFLFGALHAALMIALWVPWFLGFLHVPTALSPLAWHQHELMFGYVPAIIAGFLLTAVPNWTGRKPVTGLPLALLFALWLAGRLAIACSEEIGLMPAAVVASAFLPVLALLVLRELVAARNTRNYKVVVVLSLLFLAQLVFHYEHDRYGLIELADRHHHPADHPDRRPDHPVLHRQLAAPEQSRPDAGAVRPPRPGGDGAVACRAARLASLGAA